MEENVLFAFGLTLFAGLATGIGSLIALFAKRTNETWLSLALGFSGGVMLYVSFVEIFPKSQLYLVENFGTQIGTLYTTLAFFGGMLLIAFIDRLIPHEHNPHEARRVEELDTEAKEILKKKQLHRMGMFTALAIAIHNFPEGLATFASALADPTLGIAIAIAIAIHNIPEGIAASIPIYYATGSRKRAFAFSFLSGLAEPIGALIGYFLLKSWFNDVTFGLLFAAVGGIMVFISLDELLPTAEKYASHHTVIYGVVLGMIVMAASLILFL